MGFLRRTRPAPEPLPLALPRPDGSTWRSAMAQGSFEASTYYEMATRRAHEPDAHALADRLVEAALPRLSTGASSEDAPYLHQVLRTAAQIGAGLGLVDPSPPGLLDATVAGALGVARRGLPAMQPEWALLGAWFLAAGHFLARHDLAARDSALQALVAQL
jgi:hypothetical protein